MRNLRTFATFLLNWRSLFSFYWARTLTQFQVSRNDVKFDRVSGRLRLNEIGLSIQRQHSFLLEGYHDVKSLTATVGAKFSFDGNNQVQVDIDQLHFLVQTAEEIFILNELFVNGCYNLHSSQPVLVWDIGMNVGFASLYFASKPEVMAVASYEPFRPTYQQALQNFALNPILREKITSINVGIGSVNRNIVAEYCAAVKGSMGIHGIPASMVAKGKVTREELEIKSATEVLDEIVKLYPSTHIVAKVDCEGAEYEIVQHLAETDHLRSIKMFIIEWHIHGPDKIVEALAKAEFMVVSQSPCNRGTGLIYAVRC